MTRGDLAISYAAMGRHVFPIPANQKLPYKGGSWINSATTDLVAIRNWYRTDKNIGISCEPSELFVVDLDVKPEKGPSGYSTWCELAARMGTFNWDETYCVVTPRGGLHLYWQTDIPLRNSYAELATNIDTRGHGGYVVAAGSVVNGVEYEACGGPIPLPVPAWLRDLFRLRDPETSEQIERRARYDRRGNDDERTNAKNGLLREIAEALVGERNNELNWTAYKIAVKFWPLEEREALFNEVAAIAREIGLTETEIEATIRSARRSMT